MIAPSAKASTTGLPFVLILSALMAFTSLSTDIYLPAMPMLARAMIRDLFSRTRAAQMLSTLVIVMAIAPIAGPLIGGLMFISLWWLPETLAEEKRVNASVAGAFRNYAALLRHRKFMQFTLSLTCYYVAALAAVDDGVDHRAVHRCQLATGAATLDLVNQRTNQREMRLHP